MVLEAIISPLKAEKRPWELFFVGFLYSFVAILLSIWIFDQYVGLMAIFFTVLAAIPLFYSTVRLEEKKDTLIDGEKAILREHSKAIVSLMMLFLGISLSFILWYVFIPESLVTKLFDVQLQTISQINANSVSNYLLFTKIFFNNMKVLTFTILFSFFYGAGSIFILTWNASIIATAVGTFVRNGISDYAQKFGLIGASAYFQIFSLGLLRYFTHGIFEVISYFIAGLAGGIISIAITKHDFRTKKFESVLLDVLDLIIIAIFVLFVAGIIEVYVTPRLF